jgi:hypothetical protein
VDNNELLKLIAELKMEIIMMKQALNIVVCVQCGKYFVDKYDMFCACSDCRWKKGE